MENTNARYESHACLEVHGRYDSLRFVLRLSPVVRARVDKFKPGMTHSELDFEDLIALSTYLHENIHWWQHVGSTSGFLSSLSYPLQTQANYVSLKDFLEKFAQKSQSGSLPSSLNEQVMEIQQQIQLSTIFTT